VIEKLLPLQIPAGLFSNGTPYQAKGRWSFGNLIRFSEGRVQPIGGWLRRLTNGATIIGTPNALISWTTAAGVPWMVLGTTEALYAISSSNEVIDITPDPAPNEATSNPINWQLTIFGSYVIATASLDTSDESVVNVYYWAGDDEAVALPAWTEDAGPSTSFATFATPERFLVVLRGSNPDDDPEHVGIDPDYSERRVYWPSQETLDDFVPTDENTGGSFDLTTDGKLMQGLPARGQSLIWTTTDMWTMNFIGDQLVYGFSRVGEKCGVVSKNAACMLDSGAYWMGRERFHHFDGYARQIPCEVSDYVFGNFNKSLYRLVWVLPNAPFNEVTWFYPSLGSTRTDRYVTYNYVEKTWTYGELIRQCGVPEQFGRVTPNPVLFDGVKMYDHETGSERQGSTAVLESGPVELGNGDRLMRIQGIVPDDLSAGDVRLRLWTSMFPDDAEVPRGPYTLTSITDVRWTARQVRLRFEEVRPVNWRIGAVRLAVIPAERRAPSLQAPPLDTVPFSIEITPEEYTLAIDGQLTYTAIVRNEAGVALLVAPDGWLSDDEDLATVNDEGVVTAIDDTGDVHITAFIGDDPEDPDILSNEAVIHLVADSTPATIEVTPDEETIANDGTVQLTAVVKNGAGDVLSVEVDGWTSDDEDTATVDGNGLVSGVAEGTANVTAFITDPAIDSNESVITVVAPTPADVSDLKLWVEADFGVFADDAGTTPLTADGGELRHWTSRSPALRYLIRDMSIRGSDGFCPLLDLSTTLNGHPTIKCPSPKGWLHFRPSATSGDSGTAGGAWNADTEGEVFFVKKDDRQYPLSYSDSGLYHMGTLSGGGGSRAPAYEAGSPTYEAFGSSAQRGISGDLVNFGLWHIWNVYSASNDYKIFHNGVQVLADTTNTFEAPDNGVLGRSDSTFGGWWYTGWFAAILYFNRKLTAPERAIVMSYLQTKFGL
jgi:hypothetical protein